MNTRHILPLPVLAALLFSARASAQVATICGPGASAQFGYSIGAAGDVNGDGLNDVVVGAPNARNPSTGTITGAAYVYSASGTLLRTWYGAGGLFGFSVAGAGDVNNDGRADIIVGAPMTSPNGFLRAGRAIVYSGANSAQLFAVDGAVTELHLGYSVAGAGNVNGDAFDDVIVGSDWMPTGAPVPGVASVFLGPTGTGSYSWNGSNNSGFGRAVASAGDVNGDGRSDLIVGAPFDGPGNPGLARVFSGANGQTLYTLFSSCLGFNFGASVASAGDVTGDGLADVIVGQPQGALDGGWIRGTAQVFNGSTQALVQAWGGNAVGDLFGTAVASAGDVDRDGRDDVIVGVPGDSTISSGGGGIRVYSGRTGLQLMTMSQGSTTTLAAGSTVAGLGNALSNNPPEIAYGAYSSDCNGQTDAGMVWVVSTPQFARFALGDGSGTQCPCGLNGSTGSGCPNPTAPTGGRLDACGTASVSADSVVLSANNLTTATLLMFVQSTEQANNGRGIPFGNGLFGMGGSIVRLGVKAATTGGGTTLMCFGMVAGGDGAIYPDAGDPSLSATAMLPALGGQRNYQAWYRTPAGCGGATSNLTNGISVAWGP